MTPNYPASSRTYARRTYRCPNGHQHRTPKNRRGPVICQHCSTPNNLIRMTPDSP